MIRLPNVPYSMRKNQSSEIKMRGINYTNILSDGDIADSQNVVADEYPYISVKRNNSLVSEGVQDAILFGGKLCYIKDQHFYYGDEEIDRLSNGEKHFAIINTKLVIFPDKMYFDLPTKTLKRMGALMAFAGASFDTVSLTVSSVPSALGEGYGGVFKENTLTVHSESAISAHVYIDGDRIVPISSKVASVSGTYNRGTFSLLSAVSLTLGDSIAVVCKNTSGQVLAHGIFAVTWIAAMPSLTTIVVSGDTYLPSGACIFDIYKTGSNQELSGLTIGAKADVKAGIGSEGDFAWTRELTITSASENEVTFDNEIVLPGLGNMLIVNVEIWAWGWMLPPNQIFAVGQRILFANSVYNDGQVFTVSEVGLDSITVEETFISGSLPNSELISVFLLPNMLTRSTPASISHLFSPGDTVFIKGTQHNDISFTIDDIDGNTFIVNDPIFKEEECDFIIVERRIPDLDFICECDNRLYGCSNKDRTIYASALGDPTNFFTYAGESTDSYAVAVGSEGDFTACSRYGSDVLFWKEEKLHKLVGDFPAEYTLYSYDIEGVQKGSDKSICVVNEVLYYKGNRGVYSYTGGVPSLLSASFGNKAYREAVGGSDGDKYYISMIDDEGAYTYTYLIKYGIWMLEEKERYTQLTRKGKELYGICNGKLYLIGGENVNANSEWMIQFCPMFETMDGKKTYSRLLLRVAIPDDAYIKVEVRADGGRWLSCGHIVGAHNRVVPIKIPINKCDKFEFRISGKGDCKILGIIREFFVGGER